MPDQVRFPYGDAFIFNTPQTDRLSNQLYQEQRQRELYKQQQDKALDDEFARNLTGIRDADIPELTKAYGDFKQARMQTMNKRDTSPDTQLDVLRKKANIYDVINKSKEQKDWEQSQGKQIMMDKKGMYADDAHQQLIQRMNTPVSKLDFDNDKKLLYPYSMPDLSKELKTARGDQKEVEVPIGTNKNDKFKDDIEVYKVGNNPNQFYNNLLQGVVSSNKGRNFTGIVGNKYSDTELEDLQNKYYAKINDPKFIAIHGQPQDFPASSNTDLGKAVKIETMEDVVNTPLTPKIKSVDNKAKLRADQQAFDLKKQAIGSANTAAHIRLAAGLRDEAKSKGDVESADAVLHNVYDIINEGEKSDLPNKVGKAFLGGTSDVAQISDPNLLKTFAGIKKVGTTPVPPDKVTFDKSKDQFNLVYNEIPQKDDKGNPIAPIPAATIPLSGRDYVKMKVRETYPNKEIGQINNIVDKVINKSGGLYKALQIYNSDNKAQAAQPVQKEVHNYSRDQYKSAGWTDEQINKALKAGKIKVK